MLKRVAFTVYREGLGRKLIENNDRHHGRPEYLTPLEQTRWYKKVICKLADDCPNLEEIFIMLKFPEFYRGIRGQNGQGMVFRRRDAYDMTPKDRFPVGLGYSLSPK